MLVEFKSPLYLWAEAISTACHSSNQLFFRVGKKETPYEMLTSNKPNISYYRVFGCKCFNKIKGVRLSKFKSKTLEGIFVDYTAESHTYRVYEKTSGIFVEYSSVDFDENNGSKVADTSTLHHYFYIIIYCYLLIFIILGYNIYVILPIFHV